MPRRLWMPFFLLFLASPLHAQVELSFPLEGFYRPGKYMPVRFVARNAPHPTGLIFLSAPGAVPTRIVLDHGHAAGVAPFLPVESVLGEMRWQVRPDVRGLEGLKETGAGEAVSGSATAPFRPLLAEQRLVGLLDPADLASARKLFPNLTIVPVRLDPADPLPGAAPAWEAMDCVILDPPSLSRIDSSKRAALLAGGMMIAVKTHTPPDASWPWRRHDDLFVLRHEATGPKITSEYSAAFAPVQGWSAGWPTGIRRRVLIYAVLTSIALLAVSLFRWRWTALACIVVAIVASALLRSWWKRHPVVLEKTGQVLVIENGVAQTDTWSWQSSGQTTLAVTPWVESLRPMFQQAEDRSESMLCLQCLSDGGPQMFLYRARRGMILAFMSRNLALRWPQIRQGASDGPMTILANRIYLGPNDRITGTIEAPVSMNSRKTLSERWEPVVIER